MPEGRSIPMSEVQAALYHAKETVAFLEAVIDGADLTIEYPDGTFARLMKLCDFFLDEQSRAVAQQIGFVACWAEDTRKRHCRKPRGHEGPHTYA